MAPVMAPAAPAKKITAGAPPAPAKKRASANGTNGTAATVADMAREIVPPHILKTIEGLQGEIKALTGKLSKASARQGSTITADEARKEGAELPAKDWRRDYCGAEIELHEYTIDKRTGDVVLTGSPRLVRTLLALPQEADKGGARAFTQGMIACYTETDRSGRTWGGTPEFLHEHELAAVWPQPPAEEEQPRARKIKLRSARA